MKFITSIKIVFFTFCFFLAFTGYSQVGTNESNFLGLSANTSAAISDPSVSLFTGSPIIGIPLHQYQHKSGIGVSISADYDASGVKVSENSSTLGLGWNLQIGGVVTRTVRGLPDEYPTYGYLASSVLPADIRSQANKYYYDSIDAQQDIFQFNFNGRSGKFLVGKNNELILMPLSKLNITYSSSFGMFTIVTEDGTKYVFNDVEYNSSSSNFNQIPFRHQNYGYPQAWYLSKIVAPFAIDSISFTYRSLSSTQGFAYPKVIFVNSSGTKTNEFTASGTSSSGLKFIEKIDLPDQKKIEFKYDPVIKYNNSGLTLNQILFSDSIFRYGYAFDHGGVYYDTVTFGAKKIAVAADASSFLNGINFFTSTAATPGYEFTYNLPFFNKKKPEFDTIANKRDHWGYYNYSILNSADPIPTVANLYNGVNRDANPSSSSALSTLKNPQGAVTKYYYESNEILPIDIAEGYMTFNGITSTSNFMYLNQALSGKTTALIKFDNQINRETQTAPFSGTGMLHLYLKANGSSVIIAEKFINLYDLFYDGLAKFEFSIETPGFYSLSSDLTGSISSTVGLPIVINWDNEIVNNNQFTSYSGGLRINTIQTFKKRQPQYVVIDDGPFDTPETTIHYTYTTEDGKSSGFLGLPPQYHYQFRKVEQTNGSTTSESNFFAINSDPLSQDRFAQGSHVGYSRVVAEKYSFKGNTIERAGKTIYEFTNLKDIKENVYGRSFPFTPSYNQDWALGLVKKITILDSLGFKVKVTVNNYNITKQNVINTNFQSIKLGISTYKNNLVYVNPYYTTKTTKYYLGDRYFPVTGRVELLSTIDSIFYPGNSFQVSKSEFIYDQNYNMVQKISDYDKTRSLKLNEYTYYPYHYNINTGVIGKLKTQNIFMPISSEKWITGDGDSRLLAAEVVELQELGNGNIVPLRQYQFESNKPLSFSVIGSFNPFLLVRNSTFIKPQVEFTKYDLKSNVLEVTNAKSLVSSSILRGYNNTIEVASVSNAKYDDIAYTSFESESNGNWNVSNQTRDANFAITGTKSFNLTGNSITRSGLSPAKVYIITYWTKSVQSNTLNSSNVGTLLTFKRGWNLFSHTITGVSSISLTGNAQIDELRLYPEHSNMTSSTYIPSVGATSISSASNGIIYSEYDDLNREVIKRDIDFYILSKTQYSDRIPIVRTPIWEADSSSLRCVTPINGDQEQQERNINIYSDGFGELRWVVVSHNAIACPPVCNGNDKRIVNGYCETGVKVYTSTVYKKVCEPGGGCSFKWECIYHYRFSDNSITQNYVEYSATACHNVDE